MPQTTREILALFLNENPIMSHTKHRQPQYHRWHQLKFCSYSRAGCLALLLSFAYFSALTESVRAQDEPHEAYIPILCVTTGDKPTGMVMYLLLLFADRDDTDGLNVHFLSGSGRFSDKSKIATRQAITDAAHAMGLSTDTWKVGISMPYPGLLTVSPPWSALQSLRWQEGETVPHAM